MLPLPPLPAAASVLRTALVGTLGGDTNVVNRFFTSYGGTAGTNATANTFCASVATAWNTNLAPLFPSDYTLTRVDTEDLTSATSPVGTSATSHVGTRSGNALAAGQAAVVRNHISRRYRGGHPRTYLSCFTNTDLQTAQTWAASSMSSLATAWAAFMAAVATAANTYGGGGGSQHCNVSYYSGFTNVTGPTGRARAKSTVRSSSVIDLVVNYTINPHVGSQRRRNQQA